MICTLMEVFVQHLDQSIRDKLKEILEKLKDIPAESLRQDAQGNVAPATMEALANAESLVDALVKTYAESMQEKVTQLFEVQNADGEEKPLQYQTFAEISGISAHTPKTPEGKFTINILKGYFKKSARVDQCAMLAATIRNSENIRLGRTHYEHPTVKGTSLLDISSMDLVENVSPTTGTIVVKKADGVTYDKYIDDIHNEADEVINHIEKSAIQVNGRVTRPCSSIKQLIATRRRLEYLKGYLGEKRNHISDFAHAWFENGLYGDGFMHGDLHAGNIMVSDKGATIIDFGNCIRLSKDEQDHIRNMVSKASLVLN